MLKTPTKVVSIVPPSVKAERTELKVLDEYVETIRLWSSQPTQTDTIRFDHTEVAVLPWTARAIHRFCNAPHPTHGEVEDLVTQGVAVMAKCRTDLAECGGRTDNLNVTYARQAEMMLDAAVGSVVVRGLQTLGNKLLSRGDNEDVKELNRFQHEVRRAVQQVRGSLSDAEKARATEFATLLRGGPDATEDDFGDVDEPVARTGPTQQPTPPAAPARRKRPRATDQAVAFLDGKPASSGRLRIYLMRFVLTAMVVGLIAYGAFSLTASPVEGDASESQRSR